MSRVRAPAERNVSSNGTLDRLPFRSAGAMRKFLDLALSINISSLRDGEVVAMGQDRTQENLIRKTRSCSFDSQRVETLLRQIRELIMGLVVPVQ